MKISEYTVLVDDSEGLNALMILKWFTLYLNNNRNAFSLINADWLLITENYNSNFEFYYFFAKTAKAKRSRAKLVELGVFKRKR